MNPRAFKFHFCYLWVQKYGIMFVKFFFVFVSGQPSSQMQMENKTGQWLGATVSSTGINGAIVVSHSIRSNKFYFLPTSLMVRDVLAMVRVLLHGVYLNS